jgi:hypothetical protein
LATAGGGKYVAVGALPDLVGTLEADQSHAIDSHTDAESSHANLTQWRNEGVWLLPLLLLLGALIARRGWL